MARMLGVVLRGFLSLVSFLTIYPVPSRYRSLSDAASSFYLAPLVGLLRGLPGYIVLSLGGSLPSQFLAGVSLAIHVVVQGFLHIDGFIDFSEALLAHRFGRDARAVIKDRYRGSYAIAAMGLYVVLLYSSLASIDPVLLPLVFLLGEVVHGASMVICLSLGRIEPYEGLGRVFKEPLGMGRTALSIAITIAIYGSISILSIRNLPLYQLAASLLIPVAVAVVANRVLGYASGDVAGFSGEASYIVFAASWVVL